ncbi:V-snare-domain-containing protein [Microstroma glucosiphilum]|uniref:V-snare-domain-containing protein n=1 Tax=Pseudomicrostroma glucosiphilum TaxID=1684307 RepID=A0A316U9I7_9BASI|nr:V-snare-domain-containing protein [Pseudomicrostroma glucosiphilum]PWN21498.1 V-snare-domain-containing protein [Pseudomicrostroma glucosiphilum]
MADLFDSYSTDFSQLLSSISTHLNKTLPSQSGEARKSTLRRCEMELEEAEEVLAQMDVEVQGFPQSVKSKYSVQMRGFRSELDKVSKQLNSQMAKSSGYDPSNPFVDSSAADLEANNSSQAQRQRLLQGTSTLEDGQRRLEESNRIALETEDLGADILRDLRGQREQIEHSRDTLRNADNSIDRSSKTLSTMIRR